MTMEKNLLMKEDPLGFKLFLFFSHKLKQLFSSSKNLKANYYFFLKYLCIDISLLLLYCLLYEQNNTECG